MRPYAIFLILFTFVMLSTPPVTDSAADANELSAGAVSGLSRNNLWALRLASDFSIVQSRIAEMMVHDELAGRAKDHLLGIEKTFAKMS